MIGSEAEPYAFVSSLTAGRERLRLDLFELGQEDNVGRYVWVCEHPHCRPDLGPGNRSPLEVVDELFSRVRAAQIYLLVLGGSRHGTALRVDEQESVVSHFEAEIFQAALLGKRVELFVARGFEPGPRMRALLEILHWALPDASWRMPMSDMEILAEVRRLLTEPIRHPIISTGIDYGFRRRLVQQFHQKRRTAPRQRELLFLDGKHEPPGSTPNLTAVNAALTAAQQTVDQERKLNRLWIALRELMAAPYENEEFTACRPLWNQALGLWEGAAAWYGLHAHIFLGGRAAVGSVARVRELLRADLPPGASQRDFPVPATGLASATYSIAKLAPSGKVRRDLFAEALDYLNIPADSPGHLSDLLALRGSILLRTRHYTEAVLAYEECLRLRLKLGWSAERIGDSMSELGFAYLFTARLDYGRDLLETGNHLLESGGVGFLIRAKKKLAVSLFLTGQPIEALHLRKEARYLAQQHRMFDQLG